MSGRMFSDVGAQMFMPDKSGILGGVIGRKKDLLIRRGYFLAPYTKRLQLSPINVMMLPDVDEYGVLTTLSSQIAFVERYYNNSNN